MSPPTGTVGKWVITLTVVLGAFIAVMDISVVNVAMPHMMGNFGSSLSSATWIATSYSIAEIILATMAGWWSVVIGRKRLFMISFAIFTAGSIMAGFAHTLPQMLLFRTIQGIGGGSLIPVSQAILRETFPEEEQGMSMAVYSMGVVLAPAFGPVLGGWLTDRYGWQMIFFINVPIGIAGLILAAVTLRDPPYLRRGVAKVDWGGIALLTISLTTLQLVLERGQEAGWFKSPAIVGCTLLTATATAALIWWELRVREPVVNLRLLRNRALSVGSGFALVFGIGLFGTTFVVPLFTQQVLGYSALHAGLILLPRALVLFVMMPIVGWLYRRAAPRPLVFVGVAFICISYYDLARLSLDSGFWQIAPILMLMGVGMPFMFVTLTTLSLSTVRREEITEASSIYTLSRRVGGNIGYALAAGIVAGRVETHAASIQAAGQAAKQAALLAYNDTSKIFGFMFLATIPLLLLLPKKPEAKRLAALKSDCGSQDGPA